MSYPYILKFTANVILILLLTNKNKKGGGKTSKIHRPSSIIQLIINKRKYISFYLNDNTTTHIIF